MISTPHTLIHLVNNIDIVTSDARSLAKDFYSEESLQNAFGPAKVVWSSRDEGGEIRGKLELFRSLVSPGGRPIIYEASIVFSRIVQGEGSVSAHLSLWVGTSDSASFEDIERIFGNAWKYSKAVAPSMHGGPPAATRPHGNDSIEYDFQGRGVRRHLKVVFHPNATLLYIDSVVAQGAQ